MPSIWFAEQPDASAEQYGRKMKLYLISKSSLQIQLGHARAKQHDILIICGGFCLLDGALKAICDEMKGHAGLSDPLPRMMRKNECGRFDRTTIGEISFNILFDKRK